MGGRSHSYSTFQSAPAPLLQTGQRKRHGHRLSTLKGIAVSREDEAAGNPD